MIVKLGDLTAKQIKKICEKYFLCEDNCPFRTREHYGYERCYLRNNCPSDWYEDFEVDIPFYPNCDAKMDGKENKE